MGDHLVVEVDQELWAIEVKLTTQPSRATMARLNRNADLIGAHRRFLVSRQAESFSSGAQTVCDVAAIITEIAEH